MTPKWIWSHDPELYAKENYEKARASIRNGVRFDEDESFRPNYPLGYKFEPWSIEQIMEDKKTGRETNLGAGDWIEQALG